MLRTKAPASDKTQSSTAARLDSLILWPSVIGHGIGGKYIPIMARLAKARRWSKQWQTYLSSPNLAATQINDGAKIQVRQRHVLRIDPTKS
jgi:hypothetical protein